MLIIMILNNSIMHPIKRPAEFIEITKHSNETYLKTAKLHASLNLRPQILQREFTL